MYSLRVLKNRKGRSAGYASCGICGNTYDWKDAHAVPITDGRAGLPYCEECHRKKTLKDKEIAGLGLVVFWRNQKLSSYDGLSWDETEYRMLASIRKEHNELLQLQIA